MEFTMTSLMTEVGTVFTKAIEMVGTVAETVTSTPILLLPVIIGLCGIGIGFFNRLKQ